MRILIKERNKRKTERGTEGKKKERRKKTKNPELKKKKRK